MGWRSGAGIVRLIASSQLPSLCNNASDQEIVLSRPVPARSATEGFTCTMEDQSTMKTTASDIKAKPAGVLLRQWRDVRRKTQLDLSFDAGVSLKHKSFVESGRSIPSHQTLLDLAQALDVPLRGRNTLLWPPATRHIPPADPRTTNINNGVDRVPIAAGSVPQLVA